jgi:alpha/beta superfamily hydrolase
VTNHVSSAAQETSLLTVPSAESGDATFSGDLSAAGLSRIERVSSYFEGPRGVLLGHIHRDRSAATRDVIVVICNPIGHEYVHAHRALRHLADTLARAGIVALRFDYDGVGDSSGTDSEDGRLEAWRDSVVRAVEHARRSTNIERVCLLGLRFGATLAALAARAAGAQHLVLWDPYTSGKQQVRNFKALAITRRDPTSRSGEFLDSAGFVVSHETLRSLLPIKLLNHDFRGARSAFVVHSEDNPRIVGLQDHLTEQGVRTRSEIVPGCAEMMLPPEFAQVPYAALETITLWIRDESEPFAGEHAVEGVGDGSAQLCWRDSSAVQGVAMEERHCRFGPEGLLFGIVTRPSNSSGSGLPVVVLPNAGASHHVGPNRLYVTLARELAGLGIMSLRFDLAGLGESVLRQQGTENDPFPTTALRDLTGALDFMASEYDARGFVVGGLCSAAHAAFRLAADLPHERLRAIVLVNPLTFRYVAGESVSAWHQHSNVKTYGDSARSWSKWSMVLTRQIGLRGVLRAGARYLTSKAKVDWRAILEMIHPSALSEVGRDLSRILERRLTLGLFVSASDPGYEILTAHARRATKKGLHTEQLRVEYISGADHTFSTLNSREDIVRKICKFVTSLEATWATDSPLATKPPPTFRDVAHETSGA